MSANNSCGETSLELDSAAASKPPFRFDTPLYLQRYDYTLDIIRKYDCKTYIDIGCADCKLIKFVKNSIDDISLIVGVDVDEEALATAKQKFTENLFDLMHQRKEPLEVYFLKGNIAQPSPYFLERLSHKNMRLDLVSLVEVIEHMHMPTLKGCIQTVFGLLKPRVVLITTPNGEFNVVFEDFRTNPGNVDNGEAFGEASSATPKIAKKNNGFRHWDHKFEWTRQEFETWCQSEILDQFSDYELVCYDGLGLAPSYIEEDVGFCTQIAVIKRKDESTLDYNNDALDSHLKKLRRANYLKHRSSLNDQKSLYDTEPFINYENFNQKVEDGEEYKVSCYIRYPFESIEYENEEERERDAMTELQYLIPFMTSRPAFRGHPANESSHVKDQLDYDEETILVAIEKLCTFTSLQKFNYSSQKIAQILRNHNYEVTPDDKYLIHRIVEQSERSFNLYEEDDQYYEARDPRLDDLNESWSVEYERIKTAEVAAPKHHSPTRDKKKKSKSKKRNRGQDEPVNKEQFEDTEFSDAYLASVVAQMPLDQAFLEKEIAYFQKVNHEVEQRLGHLKRKRSKQSKRQSVLELDDIFS